MALAAVGGKAAGAMIGRSRFCKCLRMAAEAFGRKSESVELANGSNLVAGIAVHHRVRPDQWEPVLVFVDVVDGDLPAVVVVAQFALGAILASMQIGVAVLALVRGVGEFQIGVAVTACHGSMAPAQGEAGARVIESDPGLNNFPIRRRMAGNARQVELAVGALGRCKRSRRFRVQRARTHPKRHREKHDARV